MRIFFVIALLSTLGGVHLYQKGNTRQLAELHEQCQAIEAEIQQCDTAEKAINKEKRRKAVLASENKRLKALLKQKHK